MNPSFKIGSKTVNRDSAAFVIAEIGHNHQGDLEKCKAIFRAAADCGAGWGCYAYYPHPDISTANDVMFSFYDSQSGEVEVSFLSTHHFKAALLLEPAYLST